MQLRGRDYKNLLIARAMERHERIPSSNVVAAVLAQLEWNAASSEPVRLENRFARDGSAILIDLADDKRRAIKISADGWKVVRPRRVLFKRYAHQLSLPKPQIGGDVRRLFEFLNMPGKDEQLLTLAWLGSAIVADIPRPVLCLRGTQGSAKSSQARFLRAVIDPSKIETVYLTSNMSQLAQSLEHHAVPVFDNLTWIPQPVGDMLCRAVTGGTFSKRQLYTDDDDVLFSFKRAMILTTINTPTNAPDLLDRFLMINVEFLPPNKRRLESELWDRFFLERPKILGGLLDALAKAITARSKVRIPYPPRMVDFAYWGTAIAMALGYKENDFIDALSRNVRRQVEELVQSNPVAAAVKRFMEERTTWKGSASKLLKNLNELPGQELGVSWPKTANHLSRRLRILQSSLRQLGIEADIGKSSAGREIILRHLNS